jgi:hypothetical protein
VKIPDNGRYRPAQRQNALSVWLKATGAAKMGEIFAQSRLCDRRRPVWRAARGPFTI